MIFFFYCEFFGISSFSTPNGEFSSFVHIKSQKENLQYSNLKKIFWSNFILDNLSFSFDFETFLS